MTCTEICGNGARTTGLTITLPLPEIVVLIKTKPVTIASPAADRGMSRPNSAAVQRAYEFCSPMQTSLWGFGWFAILPNVEKTQSLMTQEHKMTPIILHADHLILMDKDNTVIPNSAVLVGCDGRIQGVGEDMRW